MKSTKITGAALALSAAALFAMAPTVSMANEEANAKVHCFGVNGCKGKGACKTSHNSCKGQNSCKGKGFEEISKKACEKKGGKLEE